MAESTNTLDKLADRGARLIRSTFAAYLDEFRAISHVARARFEARDWQSQACDSLDRLDLYSRSVTVAAAQLRGLLGNLEHWNPFGFHLGGPLRRRLSEGGMHRNTMPYGELALVTVEHLQRFRFFAGQGVHPRKIYLCALALDEDRLPM